MSETTQSEGHVYRYHATCHWAGDTAIGYEDYDREHTSSAPPASTELRLSPTILRSTRPFTALGTVEDHPRAEVVREFLEAVRHPGRYEQDVAGRERVTTIPVDEGSAASRDHV